jgi:hypothetical protein
MNILSMNQSSTKPLDSLAVQKTAPGAAAPGKAPLPTAPGAAAPGKAPLPTAPGAAAQSATGAAASADAADTLSIEAKQMITCIFDSNLLHLHNISVLLEKKYVTQTLSTMPYKFTSVNSSKFLTEYSKLDKKIKDSFKSDTTSGGKQSSTNSNSRTYENQVINAMICVLFGIPYGYTKNCKSVVDLYYLLYKSIIKIPPTNSDDRLIHEEEINRSLDRIVSTLVEKDCKDCRPGIQCNTCIECEISGFELMNKYLKYKQKYLSLKNKIKQN